MTLVSTSDDQVVTEVTRLLLQSARLLDDGNYAGWIDLFTDDGMYKAISVENHRLGLPLGIIEDNVPRMWDRKEMIDKYWSLEPTQTRHLVSNIDVHPDGDGAVSIDSCFVVYIVMPKGVPEVMSLGRYEDRVVSTPAGWRFHRRLAIFDNHLITHAVHLPL
jgi:3-phenylpropionate/cinnamic acid dioxygenase small subunit